MAWVGRDPKPPQRQPRHGRDGTGWDLRSLPTKPFWDAEIPLPSSSSSQDLPFLQVHGTPTLPVPVFPCARDRTTLQGRHPQPLLPDQIIPSHTMGIMRRPLLCPGWFPLICIVLEPADRQRGRQGKHSGGINVVSKLQRL